MSAPSVFISAATVDLHEWRELIHQCLDRAGFYCYVQDHSIPPSSGRLRDHLMETIDKADYVFHLAGQGYGTKAEDPFPDVEGFEDFECSWTQFEYYVAVQKGKKVFAFALGPALSRAGFAENAESEEESKRLAALQDLHRIRVRDGTFEGTPLHNQTARRRNNEAHTEEELLTGLSSVISQLAKEESRSVIRVSKVSLGMMVATLAGVLFSGQSERGIGNGMNPANGEHILTATLPEGRPSGGTLNFPEPEGVKVQPSAVPPFPVPAVKPGGNASVTVVDQAAPKPPSALESAFARFAELDGQDRVEERLEAGRELIRLGPTHPRAWYLFGYAAFWAGKSREGTVGTAAAECETLFKESANAAREGLRLITEQNQWTGLRASLHSNLAGALAHKKEQAAEAEQEARAALKYDMKDEGAWGNLAYAVSLQEPNGLERQIEVLRQARKTIPESIAIRQKLSSAVQACFGGPERNVSESLALLEELESLGEDPYEISLRKAMLVWTRGKRTETEAALNAAADLADSPLRKAHVGILNLKLLDPGPDLPGGETTSEAGLKRALAPYWVVIEQALQEDADDDFALYLAALYHQMTGAAATAKRYASRVPKESRYSELAALVEFEAAAGEFSRRIQEMKDSPSVTVVPTARELMEPYLKELVAIAEHNDEGDFRSFIQFFGNMGSLMVDEKWVEVQIACEARLLTKQNPAWRAVALHFLAIAQLQLSDTKNAVRNFAGARSLIPAWKPGDPFYAEALFQEGDFAGAAEQYRELVERDPKDRTSKRNLAVSLARQKQFTEAIAVLESLQPESPEAGQPPDDLVDLLGAFLCEQSRQMMDGPDGDTAEGRLKVESMLIRAYRLASGNEAKHAAGDLRLGNYLALSLFPDHRETVWKLIHELRNDAGFQQNCAMLASMEGWMMYLDADAVGLESQSPAQLQAIHEKLSSTFLDSTLRVVWQVADWHVRVLLGEGPEVFEHMEKQLGDLLGSSAPDDRKAWVLHGMVPVYGRLLERDSGERSQTIRSALRRVLERITTLSSGPENGLSAHGWSVLSSLHWREGNYHAGGVANARALAIDPTRYGDWVNLSGSQLREVRLWSATRSSFMAFRHFPWSRRSEYAELLPMTANMLMATSPAWLLAVAWFVSRWLRERRRVAGNEAAGTLPTSDPEAASPPA